MDDPEATLLWAFSNRILCCSFSSAADIYPFPGCIEAATEDEGKIWSYGIGSSFAGPASSATFGMIDDPDATRF